MKILIVFFFSFFFFYYTKDEKAGEKVAAGNELIGMNKPKNISKSQAPR